MENPAKEKIQKQKRIKAQNKNEIIFLRTLDTPKYTYIHVCIYIRMT